MGTMLTLFGFFKMFTGFIVSIDILFIPFAYSFESIYWEVIFTVVMFHGSIASMVSIAAVASVVSIASIAAMASVAAMVSIVM